MASIRLFYFIEKNIIKARQNSMWKDYLRKNRAFIDDHPKIADELIVLLKSTAEYKVIVN
jgi:trehalose-6-phosphate synthase